MDTLNFANDPGTVIEADDHVILFLVDKTQIPSVEQLFQVNYSYV